jgi:hypothetical protein
MTVTVSLSLGDYIGIMITIIIGIIGGSWLNDSLKRLRNRDD